MLSFYDLKHKSNTKAVNTKLKLQFLIIQIFYIYL